jgi:hypothetical protein
MPSSSALSPNTSFVIVNKRMSSNALTVLGVFSARKTSMFDNYRLIAGLVCGHLKMPIGSKIRPARNLAWLLSLAKRLKSNLQHLWSYSFGRAGTRSAKRVLVGTFRLSSSSVPPAGNRCPKPQNVTPFLGFRRLGLPMGLRCFREAWNLIRHSRRAASLFLCLRQMDS